MRPIFILFLVLCLQQAEAQNTNQNQQSQLSFSGHLDTYYAYNFNDPVSRLNGGRIFDLNHDEISLAYFQSIFEYRHTNSHIVLDLTFGPKAELANFGNPDLAKILKQAYFSYDLSDNYTLTIGQFNTHVGYEMIDASQNFNYSFSYLFGTGPFYHTGAKLDFSPIEGLDFMVGIVNGWDSLEDFNDKKSFTFQLGTELASGWNLYLNWIGGDEYNGNSSFGSTSDSFTNLFDVTTSYEIVPDSSREDRIVLGLNAALGNFGASKNASQDDAPYNSDATWGGAAFYCNYFFNTAYSLGLRAEYFSDQQGVRYMGPIDVLGITLSGGITFRGGQFTLKPELRFDRTQDAFFENSEGGLENTQTTLSLAALYIFDKTN